MCQKSNVKAILTASLYRKGNSISLQNLRKLRSYACQLVIGELITDLVEILLRGNSHHKDIDISPREEHPLLLNSSFVVEEF